MKKLFYSASCFDRIHFGTLLDKMIDDRNNGHEVYWLYCHNVLSACEENICGNKVDCFFCHVLYKELIRTYGRGIHVIGVDKRDFKSSVTHRFVYSNVSDIKKITYKNVHVGLSILSSYFTYTRDLDCSLNADFKYYFDTISNEICNFTDYMINIIKKIEPDEISFFNGRFYENRVLYDLACVNNINFISVGALGDISDKYWKAYRINRHNSLPASIAFFTQMVNTIWANSKLSIKEREDIATDFYVNRRSGGGAMDWKSYTKNQITGLLPKDFDPEKRNFVIFNSSPDENAAVGGEWEEKLMFETQVEAIRFMLSKTPKGIHFYLRIHPNLSGVNYKDVLDLYKLDKEFENITIIEPTSKISSYSLMNTCEKVFVFGSTMGVESCYWGKPVILIGKAIYQDLDVCYIPRKKEDLVSMIVEDLIPKDRLGAVKYITALYDHDIFVEKNNPIDYNYQTQKCLFKEFYYVPYQKIFGLNIVYIILRKVQWLISRGCGNRFRFPVNYRN